MIQVLKPVYHVEECLDEIRKAMNENWTGLGGRTVVLENLWKEYTGYPNSHFLNSATAGLQLAIKILKMDNEWEDGDEIILPPVTFISCAHSIMHENLKPVFADVDEYLCLDPLDVVKKITLRTRAIMFVGMGGNVGEYFEIVEICKKYNLNLILDASHMAGTRYGGNIVGREADVVVNSFQAVKNLNCADAGMISFKEKKYDEIARKLSWCGINKDTAQRSQQGAYKWDYDVEYVGHKFHGNSIMAAILIPQLKYLDKDNSYRRQIAAWYDDNFRNVDKVNPIEIVNGCESSRHLYIVELENRDNVMNNLYEKNIFCGVHYKCLTEYKMYNYGKGTCNNAERLQHRIMTLPIHLDITKNDVDFISEQVIAFAQ